MSTKYPGGFITKSPVAPTPSAASGIWTLDQQEQAQQAGIWPFGGPFNFIEDVFSTYLYTGNGSTQTITNGIDLSTKGGLVWTKTRNSGAFSHELTDTVRGAGLRLESDTTNDQDNGSDTTSFNSTGFGLTFNNGGGNLNNQPYASWTFREQAKFFDIVTYTGNGSSITVPHSLGSAPGCIIVKRTNTTGDWPVYHRSVPANCGFLNYTNSFGSAQRFSSVTSTDFTINVSTADVNASGSTYVAYLFAHDAGGFGLTGTDNVISCGSVSATGSTLAEVNLGYEPQWLLIKGSNITNGWSIIDNMRGFTANSGVSWLQPNTTAAEVASPTTPSVYLTSTGFKVNSNESPLNGTGTYIYIAIRRGPMAVPTLGTSVYENTAYTGNGASNRKIGTSVLTDLLLLSNRDATSDAWSSFGQYIFDRLRGQNLSLSTSRTDAETSGWTTYFNLDMNTGWDTGSTTDQGYLNKTSATYVSNVFRRAPSFFDVVCYTGTGVARTVSHNLAAVPELMITKQRSPSTNNWFTYHAAIGATGWVALNLTNATTTSSTVWNDTAPTSSVFTVGTASNNSSGASLVAYLFATCAGISKVGSYSGSTGNTVVVPCGFTSGVRFVLIKRTDSTGDWYVWDSARGIVAGNDPYLLLNSTAAEVTGTDYVDTYSAGFEVTSTAPAGLNATGGTYIFLAIA